MGLQPRFTHSIDDQSVYVFDSLIQNPSEYFQALNLAAFTRTEVARPEVAQYRHWVTESRLDSLLNQPIYAATQKAVAAVRSRDYRPYRAYTNSASYGDVLFTHVDCIPGQGDLTALWYLCDEWDVEWGGETVFFSGEDEIAAAVLPKPGRLVLFDGAIKHAGRPPSRVCYKPRYTFAIKLEPV